MSVFRHRGGWFVVFLLCGLQGFAPPCRADSILFENSPDLTETFATTSDAAAPQYSADDFTLQGNGAYAITEVTWWGRFSGTTVPTADSSNFKLEFYKDSGAGPLINPWLQFNLGAVSRTEVAVVNGISLFSFTASLVSPVMLNAGERYFFSVFNDNNDKTDPNFAILWSSTKEAVNPRWFRQNATRDWMASGSNVNTSFHLSGHAVPEPGSLLMMSLGLAALAPGLISFRLRRGITMNIKR